MLTTRDLLAAAKLAKGIPSNYRLARVLEVPDTTVQRWNTGRNRPDDEMAVRLAEMAGLDAGQVVASIRAERAEPGPMRDLWADVAARLAHAGAAAAVACITVTGSPDALAHAPSQALDQAAARIYLM